MVTGLTRNGTFLIEDGEVRRGVPNLRFTQSFVEALAPGNVLGVGADARFADSEFGPGMIHCPSVRLGAFRFTGGAADEAPAEDTGAPLIRWEVNDGIGLATIDRPERRNALSAALCEDLRAHLSGALNLRAVVVTGAGPAFCAGADLSTRFEGTHSEDLFRPAFERLAREIIALPAPVIAAIGGPALGAGTELAVACDLRVVSPSVAFSIPATQLGAMISPENVARLVSIVGQAHARVICSSPVAASVFRRPSG